MNLLRFNQIVYPSVWTYNFLDDKEIEKIFSHALSINPENGKIDQRKRNKSQLESHIKSVGTGFVPKTRQSLVRWIRNDKSTGWLFKKIIQEVHKVNQENFDYILKYIEDLQFTEYNEQQKGFYSKHNDCGKKDTLENFVDIRKLSISIQLSSPSDYEGGDLILYHEGNEKVLPKEKGTIIFFSSDLNHEVTPVTKGTRYSLVSWVQGPNLR